MKKTVMAATLIGSFIALQCMAAGFTPPAEKDIAAAAKDPAAVAALLKDATPEQAAEVVKDVISAALLLDLDANAEAQCIGDIVGAALKAIPPAQQTGFAAALGKLVGANALLRANAAMVSKIQGTLASQNATLAGAFGDAYNAAAGNGVLGSGLSDNTPSRKGPPVAKPYPNQ